MWWPANPNPHPPVIRAKMPVNITQAIMPAMSATVFDP
jgi:hypothetical protein